ncbi:type VI secretion system-associated protein TagF [Fuscibacter oryzae]|uniref:Type VI secretion system-associated protein TagF n=1 Tax=Fuscibacter oryzae TaxID=2803939 RepID=A0A8J7MU07_9RHOB|nr:type VI secretion system-associated protein TagF [Fuscibacter oryzae]MBL4929576.1 type VI secretion system-associated protein TagF [Fuscibacter oryzae]
MALGVYGKHPAKGDFLGHGVPASVQARLEAWLDAALADAREALGADWQAVWPAAPHLHFWLGEGIWGEAVAGVMAPAQDRVGRRFPLVFLATGMDAPPPPIIDAGQDWQHALSAHAARVLAQADLDQPADLLAGLPRPTMAKGATAAAELRATRQGPEAGTLWQDLAQADHRRAAAARSYWWTEGETAAAYPDPADTAPPRAPANTAPTEAPAPVDEEDIWALAGVATDDEDSPFAGPALGLFAPPAPSPIPSPAPARDAPEAAEMTTPAAPAAPILRPAQVWAGEGLPSGAVLAWFFKGQLVKDLSDVG